MAPRDTCVIFNPAAGKGRAAQRLESLRQTLGVRAEFRATDAAGHAAELALRAAQEGFRVVAAAGGDGTVHEVANGLLRAERPDVILSIFPIGSANDYAHTLALDAGWWRHDDWPLAVRGVDVGLVRAGTGRERYFINGLGIGFNGAVTLESRRIRRLQGVPLYTVALLRALWYRYQAPVMTVAFDDSTERGPTLALTVALGRREGNFVLAPNAVVDDGLFDYLRAGALPRWELLRYVPGMITGNLPTDHPALRFGRCRHVAVESEAALIAHLDGEMFCLPEDEVRELEALLLPGALRVEGRWPRSPRAA